MKRRMLIGLVVLLAAAATAAAVWASVGDGLVSYWPLDGTALDAVNGNDGVLQGNAQYVGGRFAQGVLLDGDGDYVSIPDSDNLDITGDITLSAWIKINQFSTAPSEGYHMYILSKDTTGERSYGIGVDLTWQQPKRPFFIAFEAPTSYGIAWGTTDLVAGTWYHISGVFDAGDVSLYVDGVPQSPAGSAGSIYAGTAELRIAARQYANHQCFFNGVIDEVGIWNRALTAAEIAFLADPQVAIDIKPGSFPNCINPDANGVIPVAILTTETFDASTVDAHTVTLEGSSVRVKGKSGNAGSLEDVDGDGDLDLVVQIEDRSVVAGKDIAIVEGRTFGALPIWGSDYLCIVPPE